MKSHFFDSLNQSMKPTASRRTIQLCMVHLSIRSDARSRSRQLILFSLDPKARCGISSSPVRRRRDLLRCPGRDRASLISALGEDRSMDHDMGSGEANIFLPTSDPQTNVSAVAIRRWNALDLWRQSRQLTVAPMKLSITFYGSREFLATVQRRIARAGSNSTSLQATG